MTDKQAVKVGIDYNRAGIKNAKNLEEILCLSSLIVGNILPVESTLEDANTYYNNIKECDNCPLVLVCLACIINE